MASLVDQLMQVSLFSGLSQRQLKRLAGDFKERRFGAGTAIVQQGQMSGVDFFVITEGEASVSVDGAEVARLRPGDHFGELALIGERTRLASVTAVAPVHCLAMASWDFRKLAKDNPDISWKLLQHLVGVLTEQRSGRTE